ncbi:MAG: DUF4124 domain-containing protein [Gammaproteobacteria bacterium]|nr:DUF4124 domain-containing protein [Gammaproteobacteria bacterium]
MKSTIISMIVVLILMIAVPLVLFGDKELAKDFGFGSLSKADVIEDLQDKAPKNIQTVVTNKEVSIYKWADKYGVRQFSNLPPKDGIESEKIVLSPNTNVMEAIKIPEKETEKIAKPQVMSMGSPYSPGGMKKMIEDSTNLQEQLNQRQADQDEMIQDMFPQK